jgi:salicylate hydroxylase
MKELRVLVGAGIGGLQTALALAADGHTVTILESVKEFLEVKKPLSSKEVIANRLQVGAGIRVPPNSSRLSLSWGVDLGSVKKEISRGNRFVDWHGGQLLECPFDDVEARYGAPYYFIHRADLIDALVSAVHRNARITLRMNTPVAGYNFDAPSITTVGGEHLTGDLVICADGIKSAVRRAINGHTVDPADTGDVAYRILVPTAPLLADPEMRHLVTNPWAVHWMGPEGHAVGYTLRGGLLYNVIIDVTHRTDLGKPIGLDEWHREADNAHLVTRFADWCPEVRKLYALTGTCLKWKLADFAQLERWVHPAGRVALLGCACHPMMPYIGAGRRASDGGRGGSCGCVART